jgi:hypothetical protein
VRVPLLGSFPVHGDPVAPPPLALHPVALELDQVRVKDWPGFTEVMLELIFTAGAAGDVLIVTLVWDVAAACDVSMLGHEIPTVYCPVSLAELLSDPEEANAPFQMKPDEFRLPVVVQPVVLVDDQLTVNCCPVEGLVGVTVIDAVGGAGALMVTIVDEEVTVGPATVLQVTDTL